MTFKQKLQPTFDSSSLNHWESMEAPVESERPKKMGQISRKNMC